MLIAFLVIGIIAASQGGDTMAILGVSALLSRWWTTSKLFGVSLNLYTFVLKILVSGLIGIFAFPYQIVKNIIGIVKTSKKLMKHNYCRGKLT